MFTRRSAILLAVLTLIVGIAVGIGGTALTYHRHGRATHQKFAARNYRRGHDRNFAAHQPVIAQNGNQNKNWDPFGNIDRMRQDIDRSIDRAMQQLQGGSAGIMTPDWNASGYSSSLDVRDKGDHFEVRADLPNTDKEDVKVTTEGDRGVHVNVTQHQEQKKDANGGQTTVNEFGSYDELVTLPGPADMKDMKIDNRNGELVITIPKAKVS
jgi:HSP20 family molecular chaperone IbpA